MEMDRNTKLLLIGGGVLVAMPLIKGLFSLIKFGGNVLAVPEKVWEFFFDNDDDFPPRWILGGTAFRLMFDKMVGVFSMQTFNPDDPHQVEVWNAIRNSKILTPAEKDTLLGFWIMPKPDGIQRWAIDAEKKRKQRNTMLAAGGVGLLLITMKRGKR